MQIGLSTIKIKGGEISDGFAKKFFSQKVNRQMFFMLNFMIKLI